MFMHDYYDESIYSVPEEKVEVKKNLTEKLERIQTMIPENRKFDNLHSRSVTSKSVGDINDLY